MVSHSIPILLTRRESSLLRLLTNRIKSYRVKGLFRFLALVYLKAILFIFFHQKWWERLRWEDLYLRQKPRFISISFPVAHRLDNVPLMLRWPLICSSVSLNKKEEHYVLPLLSHLKLISSPLTRSESAITLYFVSVSAVEILNSLSTNQYFLNKYQGSVGLRRGAAGLIVI